MAYLAPASVVDGVPSKKCQALLLKAGHGDPERVFVLGAELFEASAEGYVGFGTSGLV